MIIVQIMCIGHIAYISKINYFYCYYFVFRITCIEEVLTGWYGFNGVRLRVQLMSEPSVSILFIRKMV